MGWNRALALGIVVGFLGMLRWIAPAPEQRAVWLYLIALPLGYGHILGAAAFSRSRRRGPGPEPSAQRLGAALLATGLLTLFVAYAWLLRSPALQPLVLAPVLLLFGWHIVENDLALGRGYRDGLRLSPVTRALRPHAIALAATAGVALATFATREGALFARVYFGTAVVPVQRWFTLDELTAGFLLYHTISWLIFFEARVRALRRISRAQASRLRRRVLAFHLVPCAVNAALYQWLPGLHFYLSAPVFYLFWSALHTIHTVWRRGLEPRPVAA